MKLKRDVHLVDEAGSQSSEKDTSRDLPKELIPWTRNLKCGSNPSERKDQGKECCEFLEVDMEKSCVHPLLLEGLADFTSRLNVPLVRICLSRNSIGPDGARILGKALVTNNSVEFLELEACDLIGSPYRPDHRGIMSLSKGIQSPRSTLRYINVSQNDLQPEGCRILLGAMTVHPTLTAIDISNNMLSIFQRKEGYMALGHLVELSTRLCWLNFSNNRLAAPSLAVIRSSLAINHSLTAVYARGCGISESDRNELKRQLLRSHNPCSGRKQNSLDSVLITFEC